MFAWKFQKILKIFLLFCLESSKKIFFKKPMLFPGIFKFSTKKQNLCFLPNFSKMDPSDLPYEFQISFCPGI
jgi:hypothetical protein